MKSISEARTITLTGYWEMESHMPWASFSEEQPSMANIDNSTWLTDIPNLSKMSEEIVNENIEEDEGSLNVKMILGVGESGNIDFGSMEIIEFRDRKDKAPEASLRVIMEKNTPALIAKDNISKIVIDFAGEDDSGGIQSTRFFDFDGDELDPDLIYSFYSTHNIDFMINGYDWKNNEGGSGQATVYFNRDGTIKETQIEAYKNVPYRHSIRNVQLEPNDIVRLNNAFLADREFIDQKMRMSSPSSGGLSNEF